MAKEIRYCKIDGCSRQLVSKGWCRHHYNRNYKFGDPLGGPDPKDDIQPCAVVGCDRQETIRKGFCGVHYERFRKNGDPGPPIGVYDEAKAKRRFWTYVDISDTDSCWNWTGRARGRGQRKDIHYGEFNFKGKTRSSHRLAYQFHNNVQITSAEPVHHKCGNSLCQNPNHLQVTTVQENTAEMLERRYYQQKIAELEHRLANCSCN